MELRFKKTDGMLGYNVGPDKAVDTLCDGDVFDFPDTEAERILADFPDNFVKVGAGKKADVGPTANKAAAPTNTKKRGFGR